MFIFIDGMISVEFLRQVRDNILEVCDANLSLGSLLCKFKNLESSMLH